MTKPIRTVPRLRIALIAGMLSVGMLACRVGPRPPLEPVEASSQESDAFTDAWRSALSIGRGEVELVITEQQLTSFLASRITEAERPILQKPQILLRDGSIRIYGVADFGPIEAGALVVVQPVLDPQGTIAFEITSAELGPLPAPRAMMNALSELLTEAFTGKLGSLATGIRITSLAIADGQAAIVGSLR